MPFCSTAASAFALISSSLMSFAASSSVSAFSASATVIFFSLRRAPPICWNMPCSWLVRSSMPGGAMISICGDEQRDLDLDLLVVELALAQHLAEFLPRRRIGRLHVVEVHFARRRQQHVEQALLGGVGGAVAHLARLGLARLLDRGLDQVADDRVDVAADVAHLGELGRLDLDERRVGEAREPARDLGLADAGRADHQDVLRRDLLAQRLGHLLAPPAVAQRDRDRALRGVLPDDVLVELGDDFGGGHVRHRRPAGEDATGRRDAAARRILPRPMRVRAVERVATRCRRPSARTANWPARRASLIMRIRRGLAARVARCARPTHRTFRGGNMKHALRLHRDRGALRRLRVHVAVRTIGGRRSRADEGQHGRRAR